MHLVLVMSSLLQFSAFSCVVSILIDSWFVQYNSQKINVHWKKANTEIESMPDIVYKYIYAQTSVHTDVRLKLS